MTTTNQKYSDLFYDKESSDVVITLIDGDVEINLHLHRDVLVSSCKYFENLFSFGKESVQDKISIHVDDVLIAKDVIRSLYVEKDGTKYSKMNSNIRISYPQWIYTLKTFCMRNFFSLPNDQSLLYKLNIPAESFDDFLSLCNELDTDDTKLLEMIKHNIPVDFPVEKIPMCLAKKLLEICPVLLAVLGTSGQIFIWNVKSNTLVRKIKTGMIGINVIGITFSPDGKLAVAGSSNFMSIYEPSSGTLIDYEMKYFHEITSMQFTNDSKFIICGDSGGNLKISNVEKNIVFQRTICQHTGQIKCVTLSTDGKRIASCGYDGKIKIHDYESGEKICEFYDNNFLHTVAFSKDDKYLACGGWNGRITIWEMESGTIFHRFQAHNSSIGNIIFSDDNESLISVSDGSISENIIKSWNWKKNTLNFIFKNADGADARISYIITSKQRNGLIFGKGADGKIGIWNSQTGKMVQTIDGRFGYVVNLAISNVIYDNVDKKLAQYLADQNVQK